MNFLLNLLHLLCKIIYIDIRDQKQKFISSKTYDLVCFSHMAANNLHHCSKRFISCVMTIGVVIKFKIIQIDHCHSGCTIQILNLILIVSPVENTCQRVSVEGIRITTELCKKIFPVLRVDDILILQTVDHFHYIWLAVNIQIFRDHLINSGVYKLYFCFLAFFLQCFSGNTITTLLALTPYGITLAWRFDSLSCFQYLSVQQANNRKNLFQLFFHFLCFLHCHCIF